MAVEFPSAEELKTWEHERLDFVYIRNDEDRVYMQEIPPDLHEDYELFATGFLLSQDWIDIHRRTYGVSFIGFLTLMNAGPVTAQQVHTAWLRMGDDKREVYIQAAKERPDDRLRDEIFFLGHRERENVRNTNAYNRGNLEHFISGARIDDPNYICMLYRRTRSLRHF